MLNKTSGGSSETALNELTAVARLISLVRAVTTVIPVTKKPSASRNSRSLKGADRSSAMAVKFSKRAVAGDRKSRPSATA